MTRPSADALTLKDIAAAADVSVAAVSKVLNHREGVGPATRARVLAVIEDLGYHGRSGRASQTAPVSLFTLGRYIANDAFYGDILDSIVARGLRHGIDAQLHVFDTAADLLDRTALHNTRQPALLVGLDHPDIIDALSASGQPAVIVNGMDRTMRLSSVSPDYHFGAWRATRHLLDLGHIDILHVTHPYRETIRRRIDGFRNAMEEAGLTFDPAKHILDLGSPENISIGARDFVRAALEARASIPTAIFCVSDMVALGTLQALHSMGLKVPEDVSVVGFDGLSIGQLSAPPLTSVHSDRSALGALAVSLLAEKMADSTAPSRRVTSAVDIILRHSTAAAPR